MFRGVIPYPAGRRENNDGGIGGKKISIPTVFNAGTAGTVADISTNSMYLLTIYTQGGTIAAPTAGPGIDWYCRLRFDDF